MSARPMENAIWAHFECCESAANGPSETRQERIRRAREAARSRIGASGWVRVPAGGMLDILDALSSTPTQTWLARNCCRANAREKALMAGVDRLARSLLGEPEVAHDNSDVRPSPRAHEAGQ